MSDNKHMELRKRNHAEKIQEKKNRMSIQVYEELLALMPDEHIDDYLWTPLAEAYHHNQQMTVDEAVRQVGMVFCGNMMKIINRYNGEWIEGVPGSEATPILMYVMTHLRHERNAIFSILLGDEDLGAEAADKWWAEYEDAPIW
jgi:hypothetical protein